MIEEYAQVENDEFINIFCTPVQDSGETSSRHVDSSNIQTFYQHHLSEHRWTKDHPLEQVIGNPSQSIRTRRQLESDGEMCMFALTVSRTEPKNIKEAMADSAWIESMHEGLHHDGNDKVIMWYKSQGTDLSWSAGTDLSWSAGTDLSWSAGTDLSWSAGTDLSWSAGADLSWSAGTDLTGSESHPPMLNKENYVPWSSRLLRYFKSRPNEKLIHNSILNGPYVRKIIPEPGDANCDITEIWLRVQQMIKGSNIGIQKKKAKLFNEWERFTSNERESIESYYHRFLKLMNDLKRNKHFPEKITSNLKFLNNLRPEWSRHVTIVHQTKDLHTANYTQLYDSLKYNQKEVDELKAERLTKTQDPLALMANSNNPYAFLAPRQDQSSFNQNYLQQPMPNPKDITDPTTAMNMALALMAKAYKLNYSTPTNNNQRISSKPRNRQIAQLGMNMGQDRQMQMVGGNGNQNQIGNGNLVAARAEGNAAGQNGNQIRCYNCRGIGHYARNCIQSSTSGTQTDSAPVYDTDGSAEVHENYDDNEIFNMFTQEEQYTELLEPIPESHQVPQNDNDLISKDTSVEQGGETI
nr:hypothetical protein [Tanacetum cinerariifolium]